MRFTITKTVALELSWTWSCEPSLAGALNRIENRAHIELNYLAHA